MVVFSVFDSKAEAYLQPFFSHNRAVALRSFMSAVSDERHDFHRYAGDYTLFEIGCWDDHRGVIDMYDAHISLGVASQFITGGE